MSIRGSRALNILQRSRVHRLGQVISMNEIPKRQFGYYRRMGNWRDWRNWHRMRMAKMAEDMSKHHNKYDYTRHGRRFHGHYGRHGGYYMKHAWLGGLSFGSCLAIVISFHSNESILWAAIHGFLSWIYVVYYGLSKYNEQDKNANELITIQINEISKEIDKLNGIYQNIVNQVNSNNNGINNNNNNNINDGMQYSGGIDNRSNKNDNTFVDFDENKERLDNLKIRIDKLTNDIANIKRNEEDNGNN